MVQSHDARRGAWLWFISCAFLYSEYRTFPLLQNVSSLHPSLSLIMFCLNFMLLWERGRLKWPEFLIAGLELPAFPMTYLCTGRPRITHHYTIHSLGTFYSPATTFLSDPLLAFLSNIAKGLPHAVSAFWNIPNWIWDSFERNQYTIVDRRENPDGAGISKCWGLPGPREQSSHLTSRGNLPPQYSSSMMRMFFSPKCSHIFLFC